MHFPFNTCPVSEVWFQHLISCATVIKETQLKNIMDVSVEIVSVAEENNDSVYSNDGRCVTAESTAAKSAHEGFLTSYWLCRLPLGGLKPRWWINFPFS